MRRRYTAQRPAVGGDQRAARARGGDRRRRLGQDLADGRAGGLPRRHRAGPPRPGARPHLHHQGRQPSCASRIREALRDGRPRPRAPWATADGAEEVLEPTVATYNAYAAGLLTEHGLRIGHEPDTRVIADAARYQLAGAGRSTGTPAPVRSLSDSPAHVIDYLLALDGAMSEHLVEPGQAARVRRRASGAALRGRAGDRQGRKATETVAKAIARSTGGPSCSTSSRRYRALKARASG